MTHTLHRKGSVESLGSEYVLMVLADRSVNLDGSQEKMRKIWGIIAHYKDSLSNYGNLDHGTSYSTALETFIAGEQNQYAHAIFNNKMALRECLFELKAGNFGLSVVVSGLYDEVKEICQGVGLQPHTVEYSLGVHGNVAVLPDEEVLEITTMCGHHCISPNLVQMMVEKLRKSEIELQNAAREMSRHCGCGIFNNDRAAEILKKIILLKRKT